MNIQSIVYAYSLITVLLYSGYGNAGNVEFTSTQTLLSNENATSVSIGDINQDNINDLVWVDSAGDIKYKLGARPNLVEVVGGSAYSNTADVPAIDAFQDTLIHWMSPHLDHDDEWVGWDFGESNAQIVKKIRLTHYRDVSGGLGIENYWIEGSNDNNIWIELTSGSISYVIENGQVTEHSFENATPYRYIRVRGNTQTTPPYHYARVILRLIEIF
jgi:hypothetical protein